MTNDELIASMEEASRFIQKAQALIDARAGFAHYYCYPKEQGAVKRASMDLTRALAELRKPK